MPEQNQAPTGLPPRCAALRERLHALAEGESLPPEARRELDEHLASCADCSAELRRSKEFTTKVAGILAGLRPSSALRGKILEAVAARPGEAAQASLGRRRRLAAAIAAASVAAAAGLALIVLGGRRSVAEIASASGTARVIRPGGPSPREARPGRGLQPGDRLELDPSARVEIVLGRGRLLLQGPALVRLDRVRARGPRAGREATSVEFLREASAMAVVPPGGELELRAGAARVLAAGSELSLEVSPSGALDIEVIAGEVLASDAAGERRAPAGTRLRLTQGRVADRP